jgi:5-enolpyruvylshikimate-3-phosphate synthase
VRIRIAPRVGGLPLDGSVPTIPTSKSHAQRAMCLAAFLPGRTRIDFLPDSRDVQTLAVALARLNAPESVDAVPVLDLADNGTALRVLSVLVPMLGMAGDLEAGARLRARPWVAAQGFLTRYGAACTTEWPRRVDGRGAEGKGIDWPEELEVDAGTTSQVATGVLLGAAIRVARGDAGHHLVRILAPAAPDYLLVTKAVLTWFGSEVTAWSDGEDLVCDIAGYSPPPGDHVVEIPPDPSSHTFVAAFYAIHDADAAVVGTVVGTGHDDDPHPDWLFADDLRRLLSAPANEELVFREIGRRPDTFPCLVAVAALRCGKTTFAGAPALRHKESDRIRAMADALTCLGVPCEERPDGLTVEGPMPVHDAPVFVPTPDDHRIVMAVALLGTRISGGVELANASAVAKSWPDYFDWIGDVADVTRL